MVEKVSESKGIEINTVKGILTILVFIGHILLGSLNDNIFRYIIYSFHMSLFFFISGYLLNIQKLMNENLLILFKKYLNRLIIPWVLAILIYSFIQYGEDIINNSFLMFYNPYYHLWYVPAFLGYIAFTFFLLKLKINIRTILISLVPLSLFLNYIYIRPGINLHFNSALFSIVSYLLRPQFYFYFILGIFFKKSFKNKISIGINVILLIIALCFNISLFYLDVNFNKNIISSFSFIIQNFFFCLLLLKLFSKVETLKPSNIKKFFAWIGVESLGIYLWHVLAIILAKLVFHNTLDYYIGVVCIFLILLSLIFYLQKIRFINQYLLGHK